MENIQQMLSTTKYSISDLKIYKITNKDHNTSFFPKILQIKCGPRREATFGLLVSLLTQEHHNVILLIREAGELAEGSFEKSVIVHVSHSIVQRSAQFSSSLFVYPGIGVLSCSKMDENSEEHMHIPNCRDRRRRTWGRT